MIITVNPWMLLSLNQTINKLHINFHQNFQEHLILLIQ